MKRIPLQLFPYFFLILITCLLLASSANAQGEGFSETFDDGDLPEWELFGEAAVSEGHLNLTNGSGGHLLKGWSAFETGMQLRLNGPGEFMINTHESETGRVTLLVSGSFVALIDYDQPVVEIPIELIPEGEWFHLVYAVGGGKARAEINGQLVFDENLFSDQTPGGFTLIYQGPKTAEIDFIEGGGELVSPVEVEAEPESIEETTEPIIQGDRPPAYKAGAWFHLGGPIGGLGYDIRYSYDNHDIWYVTDAWAGIHRSQDRGLTWQPINEGITAIKGVDGIPIFTVTVDHTNSQVVWIGTEGTGQLYRSEDGGDTWVDMSNGIDQSLRPLTFRGVTIHPTDPNTLYAMAEISSTAWTSDGEPRTGIEMDLTQGIVYKTTDGGRNWQEIWRGDNLARYAWINPDNPEIVYVSTGIFDRESANTNVEENIPGGVGILKSTNGGQTWEVLGHENGLLDLYVGSLYMHPEKPDTLLAAAAQNNWFGIPGENTRGIYLSEDGGQNWERVINREELFGTVEYCDVDPDIAYAASGEAVYRSEDGGHTWERYGRPDGTWGPPGVIAGFPIDMQCDPDDSNRVFVNNYGGGNFLSEDGGKSWVNASTGYSGAIMDEIYVISGQPGWVYASARSGIFRSTNGGATWDGTSYPDEEFLGFPLNEIVSMAVHPTNPLWLLSAPADLMNVILSEDGGQSWSLVNGLNTIPIAMEFSPSDPTIVYAAETETACVDSVVGTLLQERCNTAESKFFSSQDGGRTWSQPGQRPIPGGGITSLAVHPADPETVYAGTVSGGFTKTSDGGQTWSDAGQGQFGDFPARTIAVDPNQPETIFLGFDEAGLYKSTDGGNTWNRLTAGLAPESNIWSVVVDPTNSSIVYLADKFTGVLFSTDGGENWQTLNEGLTHRTALTLGISDDGTVLYVGLEGAGVYRLGTPPEVTGGDQTFPIRPETEEFLTEEEMGETEQVEIEVEDPPAEEKPDEESISMEPEPGQDQRLLGCPTSFFPLILMVGLFWIRRRAPEKK